MTDTYRRAIRLAFSYGPAPVRRFILRRLVPRDRAVAAALISTASQDRDPSVRLIALEVVARRRRVQDLDVLARALDDPHVAVRVAAAHALGRYRTAPAGAHLQAALRDPHPEVRATAARALGHSQVLDFSASLERALADPGASVRAAAAEALGLVGRREARAALYAMSIRDPVEHNRRIAEQAIAGLDRRMAAPAEKKRLVRADLVAVLLDQRRLWAERLQAKDCLRRIRGPGLAPLLQQALEDTNDTRIHRHIVEILVELAPSKELQNALIGCLHHIATPVRRQAIAALGDLGDREAIFFLNTVAIQGDQLERLLDPEDARLAREAIARINERVRGT